MAEAASAADTPRVSRLDRRKARTRQALIDAAVRLARAGQHCAPYLAALGHLLNRAPLHAGPETVVSLVTTTAGLAKEPTTWVVRLITGESTPPRSRPLISKR